MVNRISPRIPLAVAASEARGAAHRRDDVTLAPPGRDQAT